MGIYPEVDVSAVLALICFFLCRAPKLLLLTLVAFVPLPQ